MLSCVLLDAYFNASAQMRLKEFKDPFTGEPVDKM